MNNFEEILLDNSQQDQNLVDEIKIGLENENFEPFIESMQTALEKLYENDIDSAKHITEVLKNINKYPKSEWGTVFTVLMSEIITRTESGSTAFFDNDNFPWLVDTERLYSEVRSEFELANKNIDILPAFHEFHDKQKDLTTDDKWKVLAFKFYGENIDDNLKFFPATAKLLDSIPGWTSGMFSILLPGKSIPPHNGPYKGVLRYHLGIKIPENCGISVKGEIREWQEGKSLIFDDTFEHFAWNNAKDHRTVLFVDFIRPLLFPFNILNEWVVLSAIYNSDFIQKSTHKLTFKKLQDRLHNIKN